jgi:hypothetical protein
MAHTVKDFYWYLQGNQYINFPSCKANIDFEQAGVACQTHFIKPDSDEFFLSRIKNTV